MMLRQLSDVLDISNRYRKNFSYCIYLFSEKDFDDTTTVLVRDVVDDQYQIHRLLRETITLGTVLHMDELKPIHENFADARLNYQEEPNSFFAVQELETRIFHLQNS